MFGNKKWLDSEHLPMDEGAAREARLCDKVCRKSAWAIISTASVSLAVICATFFLIQRKKNKELVHTNYELWEQVRSDAKELEEARNTISYMSGQCEQLEADLEECSENCAPKPAPKPAPKKTVVKPAPKPVSKPTPVVKYEPVIIRDADRDEVKESPVVVDTVVRPTPVVSEPVKKAAHVDSAPATVTAKFRNKMAADAKCR